MAKFNPSGQLVIKIIREITREIMILPIRLYQLLISPFLGKSCRYYPSCSNYAILAIKKQGIIKGIWLSIVRIMRCNPWFPGGYDPVSSNSDKVNPKEKL